MARRVHNRKEMTIGIKTMEGIVTARIDLQFVEWLLKSMLARSSGVMSMGLLLL